MSIFLLTGIPGSGKTYHAVAHFFLPAVKSGRLIYHNIRGISDCLPNLSVFLKIDLSILADKVRELPSVSGDNGLTVTDPYFYKTLDANALVILDEIQTIYYSRNFAKNSHALQFFTQSRHLGYDILMITQRANMLDSSFRNLCDSLIDFRKLTFLGSHSKYRKIEYEGSTLSKDSKKSMSIHSYNVIYFQFYRSYDARAEGKEARLTTNLLLSKKFILIYLVIGFSLFFGVKHFASSGRSVLIWENTLIRPKEGTAPPAPSPSGGAGGAVPVVFRDRRVLIYFNSVSSYGRDSVAISEYGSDRVYFVSLRDFRPKNVFSVSDTVYMYKDFNATKTSSMPILY